MKKSILSLSAAAALGTLGFAGSAHAVFFNGADGITPPGDYAAFLSQNPGGTGHMLFAPYYSAQGAAGTLFNLVNTDRVNGKAVKVRFRGAANSDDVLDFVVFLSPGDVWTADIARDAATGKARIATTDKSCTLPSQTTPGEWPAVFKTDRLAPYYSADLKAMHVNEGYIEVRNMADIRPRLTHIVDAVNPAGIPNPLFTNIKHVGGVAPCSDAGFAGFQDPSLTTALSAINAGLFAPTGGLAGSWALFDQSQKAVHSGNLTAITAANSWGPDGVTPLAAAALVAVSPQLDAPIGSAPNAWTADPLLTGGTPVINARYLDLPDMSTPAIVGNAPVVQADALSRQLGRAEILNEYAFNDGTAAVPMQTDWVVSQPTRRYHVAVDYTLDLLTANRVWNSNMVNPLLNFPTSNQGFVSTNNRYRNVEFMDTGYGRMICLAPTVRAFDREEKPGFPVMSPSNRSYCGEVFTLQFGGNPSLLGAKLTAASVSAASLPGQTGWMLLSLTNPDLAPSSRLPMVGFSATAMKNTLTGVNYGTTQPHKWYR